MFAFIFRIGSEATASPMALHLPSRSWSLEPTIFNLVNHFLRPSMHARYPDRIVGDEPTQRDRRSTTLANEACRLVPHFSNLLHLLYCPQSAIPLCAILNSLLQVSLPISLSWRWRSASRLPLLSSPHTRNDCGVYNLLQRTKA
jgi:hypothetical protein